MNTIIKKSYLSIVAAMALVLASCTDDYSYSPAPALNNAKVTLEAEETSYYYEGAVENQEFSFKVNRADASGEATVSLVCDNNKVHIPATVSFTTGETSKTVTATSSLAKGEKITVSISAAEEDADIYSTSQYIVITLERDKYAWVTCGKAEFYDFTFSDGESAVVEVQRCEGEGVDNTYKLVNPFFYVYEEGSGDVKIELDNTGKPKGLITDNGVIATLGGYDYYYNTASYAAYCSFEKDEDGVYWVGSLLKAGSSLYTGGMFAWIWTEGYPY